tara:strand:+ start:1047 stop:1556 length:510 start_codon:yes stop_codon:yes gene_type:complete
MLTDRPIPGQSLTTAPKSFPYERPPEVVNPLDALDLHFEKLNNPDAMKDISSVLQSGIDLVTLTEAQCRSAVAEGIHSVDISLLIAPCIHEYIKGIALATDTEFNEGFEDKVSEEALDKSRLGNRLLRKLKTMKPEKNNLEETEVAVQEPKEDTPLEEEPSDGLMTRRV